MIAADNGSRRGTSALVEPGKNAQYTHEFLGRPTPEELAQLLSVS